MMHDIKIIGPIIMFVLTLAILVLAKPKFLQQPNGNVSIIWAVVISLLLAVLLAIGLVLQHTM